MADYEGNTLYLQAGLADDVPAEPALHEVLVLVQPPPLLRAARGFSKLIRGELLPQRSRGSHRVTLLRDLYFLGLAHHSSEIKSIV